MLAAILVFVAICVLIAGVVCLLMTRYQIRGDVDCSEALALLRQEFGGEVEPDHVARLPREMFQRGWDREADDPLAEQGLDQGI